MHWRIARHYMIQIGIDTSVLIGILDSKDNLAPTSYGFEGSSQDA